MPSAEEVARGAKSGANANGKSRGSVNNARRLEAFKQRRPTGGADWGNCDPRWIAGVVVSISALGGAVTFGLSRDQGAYSVTLLLDGERETLWFNGDGDLEAELDGVLAVLETM